jgi:uncharacterized glyoxalase superfamily protein PhnB
MTTIIPYVLCEDCDSALDFLHRAFGFEEKLRSIAPDGKTVWHAEMTLGDSIIFLGDPGDDYENPRKAGETVGFYVYLDDDVDAHYERAKAAGAEIIEEPTGQVYGDRRYSAKDPEGHHWYFAQRIRQVAPEEWGATVS